MKKLLTSFLVSLFMLPSVIYAQNTFEAGDGSFLLNGKPFVVKAAEVHYPRIPRPYWEHRIQMCKALGMNTICIYIFWNIHEQKEGVFDFTGNNDVAEFCRLAQKNGMYVIVRPGPYVCAEWEMGGLPWWLLKKKDIRLREEDPYFMERVKIFEEKVGEQLSSLTIQNGGPIIMVQVENEYGSYGENKPYVSKIRDIVRSSGFDKVSLFQCDWSSNFEKNGLDDLIWTMNFGTGANIDDQFKRLKQLRPNTPLMCSEFWSGWFDKWGGKHETRSAKDMVEGIRQMLDRNISFSLYMTHGGTSFGHWAGANSPGFSPDVTSYDYDAPINEYGQTTPKYFELQSLLAKYSEKKLPKVPKSIPTISIPEFSFSEYAPLFENLPKAHPSENVKTMEEYDQGWGSILYSTILPELRSQSKLTIKEGHDYVQVFVDGNYIGSLDRRMGEKELVLPSCKKGARLDILVEAMGRINFGRAIKDFKGLNSDVNLTISLDGNQFTGTLKKSKARELMKSANVPVVPGFEGIIEDENHAVKLAKEIGYPVMIKASAGGGGKGIRVAFDEDEFRKGYNTAKAEAKACFGDDTLYLEKFVQNPRHIEFQILADSFGNVVHLGERECSLQRKNQKVLEEAPSTFLTNELRSEMGEVAKRAAKACKYENAGTIEFLVDKDCNYYFMEMNTRIQVEHPITEIVSGVDIVKEQLKIASGEKLTLTQKDIKLRGHAIECRINAEDPSHNFAPCPGTITELFVPGGRGVRLDSAIYCGYKIPPYYDSMLAKLIAYGDTRDEAICIMKRALDEFAVGGVKTNISFQHALLDMEEVANGNYDTSYLADKIFVNNKMVRKDA